MPEPIEAVNPDQLTWDVGHMQAVIADVISLAQDAKAINGTIEAHYVEKSMDGITLKDKDHADVLSRVIYVLSEYRNQIAAERRATMSLTEQLENTRGHHDRVKGLLEKAIAMPVEKALKYAKKLDELKARLDEKADEERGAVDALAAMTEERDALLDAVEAREKEIRGLHDELVEQRLKSQETYVRHEGKTIPQPERQSAAQKLGAAHRKLAVYRALAKTVGLYVSQCPPPVRAAYLEARRTS